MKWKGRRRSSNVENRRTTPSKRKVGLTGGIGGIIIGLLVMYFTNDSSMLVKSATDMITTKTQSSQTGYKVSNEEKELEAFVAVVLQDTEDVWTKLFPKNFKKNYIKPKLIIFKGRVQSACGTASAATGPFYCPGDHQIYIDLAFYQDMKNKLGAPGDFAMAYVIAHEVGHHIQQQLGISDYVHKMRRQVSTVEYNKLSVKLELQADFLAGVWAHHAQKMNQILEPGDIEEALNAANAIGDDRLQKRSQGHVVPDAFTHGTSAQRVRWFKKGFNTGDVNQGDTFKATVL